MGEKPSPKKRGRKPKLDPELVAAALVELHGNIAATAKRFRVDRSSVRELIDKRPSLQKVLNDAREGMLDNAESSLYRAVLAGESWAVCFFLKTQGKKRGYIERDKEQELKEANAALAAQVRELEKRQSFTFEQAKEVARQAIMDLPQPPTRPPDLPPPPDDEVDAE